MAVAVSFVGVMLGSLCALLLGRYLLADYIKKKISKSKNAWAKNFKVVDSMFVTDGILFVALLRLMFLPYGIACYLLSATSVTVMDYMLGTAFYIIKICIIVLFGCSLYEATADPREDGGNTTLLVVDIVLTVVITVTITLWAKYEFDKRYEEI